ncbi:MAG: cation transporter [Aquabacterium sp.]|nr:MAG: cation transporter [Aquabacterium sp.]TAL26475.1 MAG: cation transporter [Aquabacterium sp.]
MGAGHDHALPASGNERALRWALALTASFLIAEVVGGVLTGSLALISDAAHMLTDAAALAIALVAIRIGKRVADSRRTFGYYRFEILAAAFNAGLLFAVAIYILVEAYQRLRSPPEIQSTGMLVIASIGLVVNLVSMQLLRAGQDSSLNIKGAYLEVWSDLLGSVGVIVGALIIRFTGWAWVDSVIAVGIGLWVLPRTWVLLRASINILLEGVPEGVELDAIRKALAQTAGVRDVHDLHVWAITSGKVSLTVHVVTDETAPDPLALTQHLRGMVAERFDIHHSTVQIEREPCEQAAGDHGYGVASPGAPAASPPEGHAEHAGHSH